MELEMDIGKDPSIEKCTDCPFAEAEQHFQTLLPDGIKKIFIANGFSNKFVISKIDDKDIENTEQFAIEILPDIIDESEYPEYYGIFKNNIKKFKILSGYKKVLLCISDFYKEQLQKKSIVKLTAAQKTDNQSQKKKQSLLNTVSKEIEDVSDDTIVPKKQKLDTLNVDLSSERSIVLKRIKEWLKINAIDIYKDQELDITLSILNDDNDIVAKVVCFECNVRVNICKVFSPGHSKRWSFSNYYKHVKIHQKKSAQSVPNKIKNKQTLTLDNYIQITQGVTSQQTPGPSTSRSIEILKETITKTPTKTADQEDPNCQLDFQNSKVMFETNNFCDLNFQTSQVLSNTNENKWKSSKYQRSEREKRRRERSLVTGEFKQTLITNYIPVLDEVSKLMENNENLRNMLVRNIEETEGDNVLSGVLSVRSAVLDSNSLLKCLYECAEKNQKSSKYKHRNRFDEELKKFSTYIFIVGGRLLYETLHANMDRVLPSITTIFRYLDNTQSKVIEGSFRFNELRVHLIKKNLPLKIWISEDATRITGKIEYDIKSNNIVGFVLPLMNGCPVPNAFIASSAKTIAQYFNSESRANYAYVIMAKPLNDTAAPFCLSIFGTNNRFSNEDVINRWEFMKTVASEQGIEILGFSSDGDPRLLKAMLRQSIGTSISTMNDEMLENNAKVSSWSWFIIGEPPIIPNQEQNKEIYIQDTVHILTKLRTRFLKTNIIIPMGNYFATVDHLMELTRTFSKDKHLLTVSDLKPEDKMNFSSAEKMCSTNVLTILENIPNTHATIAYLKIMNYILTAFLNKEVSTEERIYKMWFSVFFLRIWKIWLKNKSEFNVGNNFITTNCLNCIEINAHSLIRLIIRFREDKNLSPEMYTIWNFSSQTCEQFFRATRSLTSTYSTVVNFSMKDIMSRLKRIESINEIKAELLNSKIDIKFTREKTSTKTVETDFSYFSNNTILNIIHRSFNDAKEIAETHIGMIVNKDLVFEKPLFFNKTNREKDKVIEEELNADLSPDLSHSNLINETDYLDFAEDVNNISEILNCGNSLNLQDFSEQILNKYSCSDNKNDIPIDSSFVKISLANNKSTIIKKSSLCWLLEKPRDRVSSDRLRRFISNYECRMNKKSSKTSPENKIPPAYTLTKKKKVTTDEDSSEDSRNEIIKYADSPDTESSESSQDDNIISIQTEKYYAIIYDSGWYIGRILEITENNCKIKFLKAELDKFKWPKVDDLQLVPQKYIFYGPISLIGCNPFDIKRSDKCNIMKLYQKLK